MITEEDNQRSWTCEKCNQTNGDYNAYCEYCKFDSNVIVYNPDNYFIRDIRIYHIIEGYKTMTPQEELFAELFNHEKILVKDMDTLVLRAHREELAKIAFEARARLTAVDEEDNNRKKANKSKDNGAKGFERSLNVDERATDAINTIKERQKRMSKMDKVKANLMALFEASGMSQAEARKEADSRTTATAILNRLNEKKAEIEPARLTETDTTVEPSDKKIFNPFEKKS